MYGRSSIVMAIDLGKVDSEIRAENTQMLWRIEPPPSLGFVTDMACAPPEATLAWVQMLGRTRSESSTIQTTACKHTA